MKKFTVSKKINSSPKSKNSEQKIIEKILIEQICMEDALIALNFAKSEGRKYTLLKLTELAENFHDY